MGQFKQTEIDIIPDGWEEVLLSDVMNIIGGGTPKTTISEYWNGDIPWLSVKDFTGVNKYVYATEKTITQEGLKNSATKLLKNGSVIISARGTVGQIAMLAKDMAFNQTSYGLVANQKTSNDFLFYLLKNSLTKFIEKSYGTVFNTITTETFNQIEIILPLPNEQKSIAEILSSLDDKIELNQKMNETLEKIAQTIFKHWFIDFEFPDNEGKHYKSSGGEMISSELGEIPEGWEIGSLGDHIKIKHGFAFKGEFIKDEENENILLTPGNFKIGGGFNYNKFRFYCSGYPDEYILTQGDLIITMTDLSKSGDTLGYPAIVPRIENKKLLHNQRLGKVVLNENSPLNRLYLYFRLRMNDYRHFILGSATGSTVKHTSPSRIQEFPLIIPSPQIAKRFYRLSENFFYLINKNEIENNVLLSIRDSLLPKLMSGKIRVKWDFQ